MMAVARRGIGLALGVALAVAVLPVAADQDALAPMKNPPNGRDINKSPPPKLEDGDILVAGRAGVNSIINGHYKLLPGKQYGGRPAYSKFKIPKPGEAKAVDLSIWWSSGKWYVGLTNEIGTDAAYTYIASQAMLPDAVNGVWSIWDGSKWIEDNRIRVIGAGPRKLNVEEPSRARQNAAYDEDDDYDEELYMQQYDEKKMAEKHAANAAAAQREALGAEAGEGGAPGAPGGAEPLPAAHRAPRRVKYEQTCPEGNPGCSPYNLCKACPAGCLTCQDVRKRGGGECGGNTCFSCDAGYTHRPVHSDGRGVCESAGGGSMPYVLAGVVIVAVLGGVGYVIFAPSAADRRKRSSSGILGR